jgi:hypothetical protein
MNRARRGGLVAYVTSHGYGHLNRTAAVLNRLPGSLPVTIRCAPDLFDHWRERLRRPAELEPYVGDAGAVNPPGDSAATDGPATLARAAEVHRAAMARLDDEADHLRDLGAQAVLADAPAPPLAAAARAGVPSGLMTNFTWAEIYAEHAANAGPEAAALLDDLRAAYATATLAFRLQPGLPLAGVPRHRDVGMVVTHGRADRAGLCRALDIDPAKTLVYFYIGRYGQADLAWENLAALSDYAFVGFHEAPAGPLPNLHVVPPTEWTGADLAASCDVAVAKAGYGTVCEAIVAGTPFIYPPRVGFAEHPALESALSAWGGGVPAPAGAFTSFDLGPLLDRARSLRPGPPPFPADGAGRVAKCLVEWCEKRSSAR